MRVQFSKRSTKSDPHRLLHNLADKIDLRAKDKYIALSNLNMDIYKKVIYIRTILKFQLQHGGLPEGSCSISDIQDFFEYVLKKFDEKTVNPSIRTYIKK